MASITVNSQITVDGVTGTGNRTVTDESEVKANPSIAVAKTGTLTTRSSDTAGTLTMTSGHGFTTGVRVDLYWSGGSCYIPVLGTVSTNSCPFTGAVGDALPVAVTAVTAMVPQSCAFEVSDTTKVSAAAVFCDAAARATFIDASAAVALTKTVAATTAYEWDTTVSSDDPFAAGDGELVSVYLSHGDSGTARVVTAVALVHN